MADSGSKAAEKAENVFKQFYDTHTNSLGDTWYSCNRCASYKTEFNSTMRDHVNSKHLKIALKCTHVSFFLSNCNKAIQRLFTHFLVHCSARSRRTEPKS